MNNWRQLAKRISQIENNDPDALRQVARLPLDSSTCHVIGITGPPGSGKSTLCKVLLTALAKDHRVAALLIDPSSPFSGGAILGDRIRMPELATNPNIYIRSLSSRGNTGGVSAALVGIIRLLFAEGFDYVIIETVGAGQSEVKIASVADTTMVVAVPHLGDDIQAFKAGIMEIADIFVINKADLPGADRQQLLLQEIGQQKAGWQPPVCQTVADQGRGIEGLLAHVAAHRRWLLDQGKLLEKRRQAVKFELVEAGSSILFRHLDSLPDTVLTGANLLVKLEQLYSDFVKSLGKEVSMYNKIDHLGIAVEDLEKAVALYQQTLGLECSGREEVAEQKVRVAFFPVGESALELLEPTSPDSPIAKFIAKKGPGLHHIALGVDDVEGAIRELKAKGVQMIDETPRQGAHGAKIAFIHPKSTPGVLLELCERKQEEE